MEPPIDQLRWHTALEVARNQKQDFLQKITTLNAAGLALSISLLTGFQARMGLSFHAKALLLFCWLSLLLSIAFALTYLAIYPTFSFSSTYLHLLKEAEGRIRKHRDASLRGEEKFLIPDVMDEVLVEMIRSWTTKDVQRLRLPMLVLYIACCAFGVAGYGFLVWFAALNLYSK